MTSSRKLPRNSAVVVVVYRNTSSLRQINQHSRPAHSTSQCLLSGFDEVSPHKSNFLSRARPPPNSDTNFSSSSRRHRSRFTLTSHAAEEKLSILRLVPCLSLRLMWSNLIRTNIFSSDSRPFLVGTFIGKDLHRPSRKQSWALQWQPNGTDYMPGWSDLQEIQVLTQSPHLVRLQNNWSACLFVLCWAN